MAYTTKVRVYSKKVLSLLDLLAIYKSIGGVSEFTRTKVNAKLSFMDENRKNKKKNK